MSKLTASEVYTLAVNAGFRGNDAAVAVQVAYAESGFNPAATNKNSNGSTDYGLMQINSVHPEIRTHGSWSDPRVNMEVAYKVYKDAGKSFRPWVAYTSGAYKRLKIGGNPMAGGAGGVVFIEPDGTSSNNDITGNSATSEEGHAIGIPDPVGDAVSRASKVLLNIANNGAAIALALVFIILAVVILMRTPAGKAIKVATKL